MTTGGTKIEDYAFLSDTQTGALVSRDGCVDWLCLPRFDSPACFASLLGAKKNGHWRFFPEEKIEKTARRYRDETLILETEIETKNGAVRIIDFMPPRGENPDIIRIVEGLRGKVSMHMELIIRSVCAHVVRLSCTTAEESKCRARIARHRKILGRLVEPVSKQKQVARCGYAFAHHP